MTSAFELMAEWFLIARRPDPAYALKALSGAVIVVARVWQLTRYESRQTVVAFTELTNPTA
ncbi:hypothetical protein KOAAANKH_02213 [Brevundimonas sp. NIBR10]|uniref:hypothetical protein n=1 Tax=Brevundimonas sp. NIBR10 TaxID=3015997 RepID=UPI0022F18DA4|nr:hypothetical protein [Brevundimonas sp. NIBR10]WGM47338.1 hypothetical protein KOAAANKH_02213 [Brevundimonas sp. NIBR10]